MEDMRGETMQLKDITTLSKLAEKCGKSKETLRYRLKFLSEEDYRVLGKETIITPRGVEKILKERS